MPTKRKKKPKVFSREEILLKQQKKALRDELAKDAALMIRRIRMEQEPEKYREFYEKEDKKAWKASVPMRALLAKRLRARFRAAIKGNHRSGLAVEHLGCSVADFKLYIEKKFQPGMTWDNCNLWHLDHVKPLCKFDLRDHDQAAKACHFSNLQTLWALDNMIKGSKYVESDLETPSQGVFGIDFSQNLRQIYDLILQS